MKALHERVNIIIVVYKYDLTSMTIGSVTTASKSLI